MCPLAMDIFSPVVGWQDGKMRVPEQVPSVLLLVCGSLDGATDLNVHALNIPYMTKDGLCPGPELPALPQANSSLWLFTPSHGQTSPKAISPSAGCNNPSLQQPWAAGPAGASRSAQKERTGTTSSQRRAQGQCLGVKCVAGLGDGG